MDLKEIKDTLDAMTPNLKIIRRECDEILNDLSEYKPRQYLKRIEPSMEKYVDDMTHVDSFFNSDDAYKYNLMTYESQNNVNRLTSLLKRIKKSLKEKKKYKHTIEKIKSEIDSIVVNSNDICSFISKKLKE